MDSPTWIWAIMAGIGIGLLLCAARHAWFALPEIAGRRLIEQGSSGLLLVDRKGRVRYINGAAAHMLGITLAQAHRRLWKSLFAGQTRALLDWMNALPDGVTSGESPPFALTVDGIRRYVVVRLGPLNTPLHLKPSLLVQLDDVTALHECREALEKAQQEQDTLTATLNRLSTPVLPIAKRVILLPLVGRLDEKRIPLFTDTLLHGVKNYHARLIILDLTGIGDLSAQVADALIQTLDAARLLGAEPVLVGIQPQVAETLSGFDLDIRTLSIYSDLQAALEYATHSKARTD